MGIVVTDRPRVFIDTSVATAILRDSTARDFVANYRRNGCQILISPSVGREIAKTHKKKRTEIVEALIRECTGFTLEQAGHLLKIEVEELVSGVKWVPPRPEPIWRLRSLTDDRFVVKELGDPAAQKGLDWTRSLEKAIRGLKGKKLGSFEDFLREHLGALCELVLKTGHETGLVPQRHVIRDVPAVNWVKAEMTGVLANVALIAANVWRRKKGLGKGEGSLSDIRLVIEASHASTFLTCDQELVNSYELAASVITDFMPRIVFVPRGSRA